MDPDVTLAEILDGLRDLTREPRPYDDVVVATTVERLKDLANWLESGGFAPVPDRAIERYRQG